MDVHLVGVEPFGSVSFGSDDVDDPDMFIAGIGSAITFENIRHDYFDVIHWVTAALAGAAARELLRRHAIFAGLSTGAAYLAADYEVDDSPTVFLAADTGHRYVDAVFSAHSPDSSAVSRPTAPHTCNGKPVPPWTRTRWNTTSRTQEKTSL